MSDLNCTNCCIGDFKEQLCDCNFGFCERFKGIGNEDDFMNKVLEQIPEWVPVSERLPEKDDRYLITTIGMLKREYVEMAGFNTVSKTWEQYDLEYGYVTVDDVIAWMPMPKPYKEGEQK